MEYADQTRLDALTALMGMRMIVKRERLVHGTYRSTDDFSPELAAAGALCGGTKACAVGSLWIGAGVPPDRFGGLPGVVSSYRMAFLMKPENEGLRLAYETLCDVADSDYGPYDVMPGDHTYMGGLEILFEVYDAEPADLLELIREAFFRIDAL